MKRYSESIIDFLYLFIVALGIAVILEEPISWNVLAYFMFASISTIVKFGDNFVNKSFFNSLIIIVITIITGLLSSRLGYFSLLLGGIPFFCGAVYMRLICNIYIEI